MNCVRDGVDPYIDECCGYRDHYGGYVNKDKEWGNCLMHSGPAEWAAVLYAALRLLSDDAPETNAKDTKSNTKKHAKATNNTQKRAKTHRTHTLRTELSRRQCKLQRSACDLSTLDRKLAGF